MRKLKFTFILLSLFIGSSALMAQMTTSSLSGNITDSNGEGLAGATIVAVHVPSGTQYATFCDKSGNYGIQNMRVGGPYKVDVSFVGYSA
ncbi:MAG: carboxypeptidase-like regulatory domain-containing protein, partial [Bacteroidales bacterium]|nr:carboxypeptidase-like regulatory domain-containing protein [Bacteroidales bacterium]